MTTQATAEEHLRRLKDRAATNGIGDPFATDREDHKANGNGSDIFLSDAHRKQLKEESAISHEVVSRRGYRTIEKYTGADHRDLDKLLGYFPDWAVKEAGRYPLLYIPVHAPNGEKVSAQVKPRTAITYVDGNGKTRTRQKYANPQGRQLQLDVHPSMVNYSPDPTVEAWTVEGIKKADSLTTRGVFTVGLIGGIWGWRNAHGTLGAWEMLAVKDREWTICCDADAAHNNDIRLAMRREGAFLKARGAKKIWYLIVPPEYDGNPTKGADDYFAAGGTLDELKEHRTTKAPADLIVNAEYTDAKVAEVVAREVMDERYIWINGLNWLGWNGVVWREVSQVEVTEAVRRYVVDRCHDASERMKRDEEGASKELRGWLTYEGNSRLGGLVNLSRGLVEHRIEELDRHHDWLNCTNGVVDLTTGTLMAHDPADLMTKTAGGPFIKDATHPDWTKALEAIPEDVRDWYQLRMGQAITGHMTPDDLLVICQGGGRNGKSTINEATARAAGDYFLMASDRILLANPDHHPTELMDLQGTRYVVAEETPEARHLAVSALKKTIGTPQITARRVHKDPVTFDATHSFFLSTNYRPIIEEVDSGTWERLALVKFPYRYRKPGQKIEGPNDKRGDPNLRVRCTHDPNVHAAVLAWMVAGAAKWYELDRVMPPIPFSVEVDTHNWRKESDQVLRYIDDRLEFDPNRHIMSTELLADLTEWLRTLGHQKWSDKTVTARFGDHAAFAQQHVEKKKVRAGSSLISRLPREHAFYPDREAASRYLADVPATYMAWLGIRFRDDVKPWLYPDPPPEPEEAGNFDDWWAARQRASDQGR